MLLSLGLIILQQKRTPVHKCATQLYSVSMHDLTQLQSFRSVVLSGSVRAAADRLAFTPSAVSHHIKSLERETGLQLFHRIGRRIEVSEAGRMLLAEVDEVFRALGGLDERIADLAAGRHQQMTIGYFGSAGAQWLPDLVAYLENAHPQTAVRLTLTEGDFVPGEADLHLVVTGSPDSAWGAAWSSELLLADPYCVAVPHGHRFAGRLSVSLAELAEEPWIDSEFRDGACRQVLVDACAAAGVEARYRHQAQDYAIALAMVDRGLGVTILPQLGLGAAQGDFEVLAIADPPARYVHAVTSAQSRHSGLVDDAVRALRELAAAS